MQAPATIRAAPALAVVKVLRDLGRDPLPVLAEAGWSPALLENPDTPVPFASLGRLLAVSAAHTGCEHFGLLAGQSAGPAAIGAIGFAARSAPNVHAALRLLIQHLAHHDRGAVGTLKLEGTVAILGYRICHPPILGGGHITAGSLAIIFQLMKSLCGPRWRPLETSFALRRPPDTRPYHAQFGEQVRFDAEESAISFEAYWLDYEVSGADPELQRLLLQVVADKAMTSDRTLGNEVRDMLIGLIGTRNLNQAAVARAFDLSSSTLHRRLAALGTNFQELHDEVRCEIACRLLTDTTLPVGLIAAKLDYSEPSAFTRSFKRRLGCGPAAWRASRKSAAMPEGDLPAVTAASQEPSPLGG
jgi:AraC-like DNA-binding protein